MENRVELQFVSLSAELLIAWEMKSQAQTQAILPLKPTSAFFCINIRRTTFPVCRRLSKRIIPILKGILHSLQVVNVYSFINPWLLSKHNNGSVHVN